LSAQPQTVAGDRRLRVALLGAGRWGSNLARVLASMAEVDFRWVVDPDPAALEQAARACPGTAAGARIEPALDAADAFVVCTRVADHFEHARSLLCAGKHVLLEKPMALGVAEARELAGLAERAELTLMIGHQLLYHPLFSRIEELVREGAIGALVELRAERSGPIDLEREPDAIWALGPHDVAMVQRLVGEPPTTVAAVGLLHPERRVVVAADIDLRHPSGVAAQIVLRREAGRKVRRLAVAGTAGTLLFDDSAGGGRLQLPDGTVEEDHDAVVGGAAEPLLRECRHFIARIEDARAPRTDGAHGVAVTAVLEQASRELRAVDYLPPPSSSFMNSSKNSRCLRKRIASKALT
jgi:predicted dehydrogenase